MEPLTMNLPTVAITAQEVLVILFLESEQYVAYCPALELSSYGRTQQDAVAAFQTALEIFLEEASLSNTLHKELLQLGWTYDKSAAILQPPMLSQQQLMELLTKKPNGFFVEKLKLAGV